MWFQIFFLMKKNIAKHHFSWNLGNIFISMKGENPKLLCTGCPKFQWSATDMEEKATNFHVGVVWRFQWEQKNPGLKGFKEKKMISLLYLLSCMLLRKKDFILVPKIPWSKKAHIAMHKSFSGFIVLKKIQLQCAALKFYQYWPRQLISPPLREVTSKETMAHGFWTGRFHINPIPTGTGGGSGSCHHSPAPLHFNPYHNRYQINPQLYAHRLSLFFV